MKSMPVFFVDNQELLPPGAELHGNVVIAKLEERAKFPTYKDVGMGTVAGFDGLVWVIAGNQGVIVHLFEGKTKADLNEIVTTTRQKPKDWPSWVHQYRIDVSALMQFTCLQHAGESGEDEVEPYHLLDLLAKSDTDEAAVVRSALKALLPRPIVAGVTKDRAFKIAERLLQSFDY